ncbi:hypothetical protein ACYSNR_03895 [Enterococcus sp. LJL128]|uniref:hypothetical protein n=1 Tax=Enterococcus sp. LJL51 TaxID=3416656 RepID=UPI003CF5DF69
MMPSAPQITMLQKIRSRQILLARHCSDLILLHKETLAHEAGDASDCTHCKKFSAMQKEFSNNTEQLQQLIRLKKEGERQ